jgi:iron complex outermembrane receptor protein
MLKINRCGLFFIIIALTYFSEARSYAKDPSLDLGPIVITKSKPHFLNSYSLEAKDLENLEPDSPVEALRYLPVDLQGRSLKGGIQTDFSLRGSTFQGVLMLIDGQRINDPQTAHHNSDIPVTSEDVEEIEVIPGVNSSLFGPDAVGGAINIALKKPQDKKRVLELRGGQYRTGGGLFSISEKKDNLGVRLSVEKQESGGFRDDTDFKKFIASVATSLDIPYGEFVLNWGYEEKEFGAYDFYTPGSGYPSKEWTRTYLLNTGFNLETQGLTIKPNFLWRRHYDKFMLDKTQIRSSYLNHHRTDLYTPNIYFQRQAGSLGRIGLGLEYGEERINSTNLGKHNRSHRSIFLDDGKDLNDKLALGLSLRMDDFDGFNRVCTGSGSLKYKFSEEDSLRLGISRSMRIPSFTELYYNDPTTLGNADLSAEKCLNYQLGYDYKKEDMSFGATLFFRQEDDFIDWIKRTPDQAKWQVENIAEAEVFGIENYFRLDIKQNLALDANYTYINKDANGQGYLYKYGPNHIRHLINIALAFNLPFGTQSIGFTYKKKPGRDGWLLINANLSYRMNKNLRLFVDASNLLNVEYQEIEGIPEPGRWIEGGLRFEW